jgi:hypothetical protein
MTKRFSLTGFGFSGLVLGVLIAGLAAGIIGTGLYTSLDAQGAPGAQAAPAAGGQGQRGDGARGQGGRGRGQAAPTVCGPKSTLPADIGRNVGDNARCFELRMYTADPTRDGVGQFKGGINELHQRFREKEVALFQKHGAEIVGVWQHLGQPNTLVWMLAYRDGAHRDAVWAAFNADPEWNDLRLKYFVPLTTNTFLMSAADYSPMK